MFEVAGCGEDGIELAKLYDFDIIVLDLRLPDIDGHEVVRRLWGARVETPVLILSGRTEMTDKVRGLTSGADDNLTKERFPEPWQLVSLSASGRPRVRFPCLRHREAGMAPRAGGLVRGIIDRIEGRMQGIGRPRMPSIKVVETLRFFVREPG